MPGRPHPLLTGNIYHIYNKTIDKKVVFVDNYCDKFIETIRYYRSSRSIFRFSHFQKLPKILFDRYEKEVLDKRFFRVTILAYCLMPTHYHILIKQNQDNGISFFISQLQNSFTKFYNNISSRTGPILLKKFKSKPIISEEQLKHTSRYIHLNPYSSGLVKTISEIKNCSYSSFPEYINPTENNICDSHIVLSLFTKKGRNYQDFVLDNAEHQKTLEYCKHQNRW